MKNLQMDTGKLVRHPPHVLVRRYFSDSAARTQSVRSEHHRIFLRQCGSPLSDRTTSPGSLRFQHAPLDGRGYMAIAAVEALSRNASTSPDCW
jgi:hypothetical protein